ncbi:MAG: CARDB domain-containing protein [Candidatus Aenigmatarchaeota archaeon]
MKKIIIIFLLFNFLVLKNYSQEVIENNNEAKESDISVSDIDVSIDEVILPTQVYFGKKNIIYIVVSNRSNIDLEPCLLEVKADDGSKTSCNFILEKNSSINLELKWVPQKKGEINLKIDIYPPANTKELNTNNNQLVKKLIVIEETKKETPIKKRK